MLRSFMVLRKIENKYLYMTCSNCMRCLVAYTFCPCCTCSLHGNRNTEVSYLNTEVSYLNMEVSYLDIGVSYLDIEVSYLDMQISYLDIEISYLDIRVSYLDIGVSCLDIEMPYLDEYFSVHLSIFKQLLPHKSSDSFRY